MRLQQFVILSRSFVMLLWLLAGAHAQSTEQSLPTAVLSNQISGRIDPLDVGDPRLTRHYYAFSASAGDLLITVDSNNLNGDIDVFTAVTFRPLMKTTVYADVQSGEITKGIYLRADQILILRVEARTPNDDAGSYKIRFGGTFRPFSGGIPAAEKTTDDRAAERDDANRLSSVGATIPRPVTESAEARPTPEKAADEAESAAKPPAKPAATPSRRNTARNSRRGSRPAPARPTPARPTESTTSSSESEKRNEPTAKPSRSRSDTAAKKQELPQLPSTRLVIEQTDGTRIERSMSTVRRVIVEGDTIVIVLKTGKIERVPMSQVVRMAIEPE